MHHSGDDEGANTNDGAALADRVAAAYLTDVTAVCTGALRRQTALVAGVRCIAYGIAQPWAAQAIVFDEPRPAALAEALAWLAGRADRAVVMTRAGYAGHPAFADRVPDHELPALVLTEDRTSGMRDEIGLDVGPARDPAEFLAVYGAELAPLVTAADLADPSHTYLVGRRGGRPVAVAKVHRTEDAGYVGGVTVLPECRRRGFGTAMSLAATRAAVRTGASLVWLHSTPVSQPIYERLGYRIVDTHVQFV